MRWENALIIGASGGIGSALCAELGARGIRTAALSRSVDGLDVTDEASVERVLGALSERFDLIIVASGALVVNGAEPEKSLKHINAQTMLEQFAVNAIGPALILRHAARLVRKDRPAHLAVLSARVGSISDNRLGGWHSYRAAKAAVNQIMRGASIELARTHKHLTCVALHPGTVQTPFTAKYVGRHPAVPASEAAIHLLDVLEGLTPAQTGGFFDWSGAEVPW